MKAKKLILVRSFSILAVPVSFAFLKWRCFSDMGIPIPKTLVIWASPSRITLAIWVRVRVTWDAHITVTAQLQALDCQQYLFK